MGISVISLLQSSAVYEYQARVCNSNSIDEYISIFLARQGLMGKAQEQIWRQECSTGWDRKGCFVQQAATGAFVGFHLAAEKLSKYRTTASSRCLICSCAAVESYAGRCALRAAAWQR